MDPNLEAFRKKLLALAREHDVTLVAVAASRTNAISSLSVETSWTCAWMENDKTGEDALLHIDTGLFPPNQREEVRKDTATAFLGLEESCRFMLEQVVTMRKISCKNLKVDFFSKEERP